MKIKIRVLLCLLCCLMAGAAEAEVSITRRAGDSNGGFVNSEEFELNKSNVNSKTFGLLNSLDIDAKVEAQPLLLANAINGRDDLLIIATMKNEIIGVNARTLRPVYQVKLGEGLGHEVVLPDADERHGMDVLKHTPTWGISATPVIDPKTNTLFVAAWLTKDDNNALRDYWIFALDPLTGKPKSHSAEPVRVEGISQEGNGCEFNDALAVYTMDGRREQFVYPKLRAGLGLTSNNGLVLAFTANSEAPAANNPEPEAQTLRNNPHGFVFAYDTRGLLGEADFSRTPAVFCTTGFAGWGAGISQAGAAPAIEFTDIFVSTGRGSASPNDVDLAESLIKLVFIPNESGERPQLAKLDFFKAFLDRPSPDGCLWSDSDTAASCGRAAAGQLGADWDFGADGPILAPGSGLLLQGSRDGVIYSFDRTDLGKTDHYKHLWSEPPLIATYDGGYANENLQRAENLNRNLAGGDTPDGLRHSIQAMAVAQHDKQSGIFYVWGENSNLKAYDFYASKGLRPQLRAEGDEKAAKIDVPSGGLAGGLLSLSGKPFLETNFRFALDYESAIVWAVYPVSNGGNGFAEGRLVAYDASGFVDKKLKRLFRTGDDYSGGLGLMSELIPPMVANGRVYVMTYRAGNDAHCTPVPGAALPVCSQLQVFGLTKQELKRHGRRARRGK